MNARKCLLNFAASYSGGGFKRLYEYARWFDQQGGASFIIHPRCKNALSAFHRNRFFIADQPRYQRLLNDCGYLGAVVNALGSPDLYYSYGIPMYTRVGRVNWFHLSNILPLHAHGIPLTLFERLKFGYLGRLIKQHFRNADVISAESDYGVALIDRTHAGKLFVSVNGSDDELNHLRNKRAGHQQNMATIVGTDSHKALWDSYRVFEMLRDRDHDLKLTVIGNERSIPRALRHNTNTTVTGLLPRSDVIDYLNQSRYYISTTRIENSYNAACEGVFFAGESYISDIGPHRELLMNMPFDRIRVPDVATPILHVKRDNMRGGHLKTWDDVITEMIERIPAN